ncbi:hypothetical protein AAG906_022311 [Vitis piasezkii]
MDTQQRRHVVLEDTPSDLVPPPPLPVQMLATQTLHTISHDQVAVVSPIVTPVTRIRWMRDPNEKISWNGTDDMPMTTLPVNSRMPEIERYTGVGCPRIHLRLYSTIMRALGLDEAQLLTLFSLSLSGTTQRWYASLKSSHWRTWEDLAQEFLRQYSFSSDTSVTHRELEFLRQKSYEPVSFFISRWREKVVEMIERPTERDHLCMFLRSLQPRSLVQALFDVDDGISRGLWSYITLSPDTKGKRVVGSSESYGGICSASFEHRQPSYHPYARSLQIPRNDFPPSQHRHPLSRHWKTYSDLGMPLDRAFEKLKATGFLVPLASRPFPSTLSLRFHTHEFCAFHHMVGHRTDYCTSLRHTIHDLIDSGTVSFPISTTYTNLGPDMTIDSFPSYSTHAIPPSSSLYHHVLDTLGTYIHKTL